MSEVILAVVAIVVGICVGTYMSRNPSPVPRRTGRWRMTGRYLIDSVNGRLWVIDDEHRLHYVERSEPALHGASPHSVPSNVEVDSLPARAH